MPVFRDLSGSKFGRLAVQWWAGRNEYGHHWFCLCDCGAFAVIFSGSLTQGLTQSCGCLRRERTSAKNTKHGCGGKGKKRTPEYHSWTHLVSRCTNPKHKFFADYGGRGIVVCDRWLGDHGFENFLADMGEKPEPKRLYSIDREEVDGNYEPDNCRWATKKEQNNNQRRNKALAQIARLEAISRLPIEQIIAGYETHDLPQQS